MLIWLLVTTVFAVNPAPACSHGSDRFNCVKFVKNYDGDTITVDIPNVHSFFGNNVSVRVRGIDTPEMKGKAACEKDWARTAKKLVESELSHAKRIDLQIDYKNKLDKYGRLLANVLYDRKSLSKVLIDNHLAIAYDGGHKPDVDWCKQQALRQQKGRP